MTRVTVVKSSIMVLGHSGSGEPGHDLACCAVSTLTQTTKVGKDLVKRKRMQELNDIVDNGGPVIVRKH